MCGFVGTITPSPDPGARGDLGDLDEAVARVVHRGPDGRGVYRADDGRVLLGHTRLSIIDLSEASAQPFRTARSVLVYNGEVYNYRQLRDELTSLGVSFVSQGDTEVVARAYEAWGAAGFARLKGMFALALHDLANGRVVLARDPFGIKPLYLARSPGRVAFGSEVKSLAVWVPVVMSGDSLLDFSCWGFPLADDSAFQDIRHVAPGEVVELSVENGAVVETVHRRAAKPAVRPSDPADVERALDASVRDHMIADVPVAVALSGGLDSSVVAALAARETAHLTAFTATFYEAGDAEVEHARMVASRNGFEHVIANVAISDLEAALDSIAYFIEEPIANANHLVTMALGAAVRRAGYKVILVGEGSDEIFAGYPWHRLGLRARHRDAAQLFHAWRARCGIEKVARCLRPEALARTRQRERGWVADFDATLGEGSLSALLDYERKYQLQYSQLMRVDRLTMASGVEARVPYLYESVLQVADGLADHQRLKTRFWQRPERDEKIALARAAADLLPSRVLSRPKFGGRGTVNLWATPAVAQLDAAFHRVVTANDYREARQCVEAEIDWHAVRDSRLGNREKLYLILLAMTCRHALNGFRERPAVAAGIDVALRPLR